MKETNSTYRVHRYSTTTGTGTLRSHLINFHLDEWVSECKKENITIKAEAALEAIAAQQGITRNSNNSPCPQFSPEAFTNALVDFIVATDQVLIIFSFLFFFPTTKSFF
jgi:hypothetical protein